MLSVMLKSKVTVPRNSILETQCSKKKEKHLKPRKQIIFHTVNFSHERKFLVGHNFFKYMPFHVELLVLENSGM